MLGVLLGSQGCCGSVMSLQGNVTMSPPPAMGWGGGSCPWSCTSSTQIPNILTVCVVLKGFYFQISDFSQDCFSFLLKPLSSAACPSCAQATNSDKEQPIGRGMQGPAGWTVYLLDWRYWQHGMMKICC